MEAFLCKSIKKSRVFSHFFHPRHARFLCNLSATYAATTGQFAEYPNLCFVDTPDNTTALGVKTGQHAADLFGALSDENVERIKRQNRRKISPSSRKGRRLG